MTRNPEADKYCIVAVDAAKYVNAAMICTIYGDILKMAIEETKEAYVFTDVVLGIETTTHYYEEGFTVKKTWLFILLALILILGACESDPEAGGDIKENPKEKIEEKEATPPIVEDEISAMLEKNTDFSTFVEKFYALPKTEQSKIYREGSIHGKTVLDWSGVVIEVYERDIIIYAGDPALYNNEDWNTITSEKPELMPYSLVVSMQDPEQNTMINPGDIVSVTGRIAVQGNEQQQSVWSLENGLIIQQE